MRSPCTLGVNALAALPAQGFHSLILLPLISKGHTIGAFLLASRRRGAFANSQVEVLQHVGGHLASAVDNAQLFEQLKVLSSQLEETVQERSREVFEVKQYLESLVETAGDAIVTVDREGKIDSWNTSAQEILGYSKEEVAGRDLCMLASGESARDQLANIVQTALEGRTTSNVETSWLRKDRKEATVSLTVPVAMAPLSTMGNFGSSFSFSSLSFVASTRARAASRSSCQVPSSEMESFGGMVGGFGFGFGFAMAAPAHALPAISAAATHTIHRCLIAWSPDSCLSRVVVLPVARPRGRGRPRRPGA